MDQIIITDLLAHGIIGINDWERKTPQEILINVVLFTDLTLAGSSDHVDDSVNYRTVAKKILGYVETSQRFSVEALAADLARLCLDEPRVQRVRIRVEKPGAVRYSRSVGVEIEREKRDFE